MQIDFGLGLGPMFWVSKGKRAYESAWVGLLFWFGLTGSGSYLPNNNFVLLFHLHCRLHRLFQITWVEEFCLCSDVFRQVVQEQVGQGLLSHVIHCWWQLFESALIFINQVHLSKGQQLLLGSSFVFCLEMLKHNIPKLLPTSKLHSLLLPFQPPISDTFHAYSGHYEAFSFIQMVNIKVSFTFENPFESVIVIEDLKVQA